MKKILLFIVALLTGGCTIVTDRGGATRIVTPAQKAAELQVKADIAAKKAGLPAPIRCYPQGTPGWAPHPDCDNLQQAPQAKVELVGTQKFVCPGLSKTPSVAAGCPQPEPTAPVAPDYGNPTTLPIAPEQPAIGVPSAGQNVEQSFATIYPNHRVVARFPVRDSLKKGTGGAIRAEIFNLYLQGVGPNQDRYNPNAPLAISDATDTAAREALNRVQARERKRQRQPNTLSILKRGNLLNGEELIFLDNIKFVTCRSTNRINSFGEVVWACSSR